MSLLAAQLPEAERLKAASAQSSEWGRKSLDIFDTELTISADPLFAATARDLDLANKQEKVLFLPTHRSLFDHPVMSSLLHDPRFLELMGWREPPTPVNLAPRSTHRTRNPAHWRALFFANWLYYRGS